VSIRRRAGLRASGVNCRGNPIGHSLPRRASGSQHVAGCGQDQRYGPCSALHDHHFRLQTAPGVRRSGAQVTLARLGHGGPRSQLLPEEYCSTLAFTARTGEGRRLVTPAKQPMTVGPPCREVWRTFFGRWILDDGSGRFETGRRRRSPLAALATSKIVLPCQTGAGSTHWGWLCMNYLVSARFRFRVFALAGLQNRPDSVTFGAVFQRKWTTDVFGQGGKSVSNQEILRAPFPMQSERKKA